MNPLHLILAFLVAIAWGFNWVVITVCLEGVPPLLLAFIRFFLLSIPAIFFIKPPAAPVKLIVSYGLIMFALQFGLLFIGMYIGLPPGLASLIIQFQVFFTMLCGTLYFGEKITPHQLIGAAISFTGLAIVGFNINGNVSFAGTLLILGAAVSWSIGNVISKKIGHVNMVSLVIWGAFVAWPPLLITACLFEGYDKITTSLGHLSLISILGIIYLTFISTLFGFSAWSYLVNQHKLSTVAPFTLLVPLVAMSSSVLLLGEALYPWKIAAGSLILSGLGINLLAKGK